MTPRTIKRFSHHYLKLEPFNIGTELILAVILAGAESRTTNKQTKKHARISLKTKITIINSNNSISHFKISGTPLIVHLWTKY